MTWTAPRSCDSRASRARTYRWAPETYAIREPSGESARPFRRSERFGQVDAPQRHVGARFQPPRGGSVAPANASASAATPSIEARECPGVSGLSAVALTAVEAGSASSDAGFADVPQTLSGIALEATREEPPDRRRHRRRQLVERDVVFDYRRDRLGRGLAAKQATARQHLEQHYAERPDVRAFVDGPPLRLLGRHVRRRAENQTPFGPRGRESVGESTSAVALAPSGASALARPKSRTFTAPSGVTFTLAGLRSRWTMPCVVCRLERLCDLEGDGEGVGQADALGFGCARGLDNLSQRPALGPAP